MELTFPGLTEDQSFIAKMFVERFIAIGNSVEFALNQMLKLKIPMEDLQPVADYLQDEINKQNILRKRDPRGLIERPSDTWFLGDGETWQSYRNLLSSKGALSEEDIDELDRTTDDLMNEGLRPPFEEDFKVRRGLVLGHVQSGKTTNFTSMIAKAADAGYKLIIVLTGMNENLRVQTQLRIERHLIDLKKNQWILLTDVMSDFRKNSKNVNSTLIGLSSERPIAIAIMKKNSHILFSFYKWLAELSDPERSMVPMLVIDDEADQASPDAGANTQSKINFRIEELTDPKFMPKNVYLGYTATPFANFFMDASTDRKLYPKNLIYPLTPGSGYFGAIELFGRDLFADEIDPIAPEIYVIRDIPESEGELISHSGWEYDSKVLEEDFQLIKSFYWFLLASACRNYRTGSSNWNTMLIHTSSLTSDHFSLASQIGQLVHDVQGSAASRETCMHQLELLWNQEKDLAFESWTGEVPEVVEIRHLCLDVLDKTVLKIDNSKSNDRIFFESQDIQGNPIEPYPQIVVGGNTLSRGLTLEGLVSSYFIRKSEQYDTVLQMARWFGYRPGYEDLIRIWMPNYAPKNFKDTFKKLALVEVEIREEIEEARRQGKTPAQLPIRIRQLPGLQITRRAAMKFTVPDQISFRGQRIQVNTFENSHPILESNRKLGEQFLSKLIKEYGFSSGGSGFPLFERVASTEILTFLNKFQYFDSLSNDDMRLLAKYISVANSENRLLTWNVYVASPKDEGGNKFEKFSVGEFKFSKIRRAKAKGKVYLQIPTLTSRPDPVCDIFEHMLSSEALKSLLRRGNLTSANIKELREDAFRDTDAPGLLGLYFIDKMSEYRPTKIKEGPRTKGAREYEDLKALDDVLAFSATIPSEASEVNGIPNTTYVQLDPSRLPPVNYIDEEEELIKEADDFYGSVT